MAPAGSPGRAGCSRRRLQRQDCLPDKNGAQVNRHGSLPVAGTSSQSPQPEGSMPVLQKHSSYPPMTQVKTTVRRRPASPPRAAPAAGPPRASHTPAMRAGPPLSCNFCWNTVDESGRILRRKTQFHCPECRTNLCIVPCFQLYHDCVHSG